MSNSNKNLFGTVKPVAAATPEVKPPVQNQGIKLNIPSAPAMSDRVKGMPQQSTLAEKTKGFKFKLPATDKGSTVLRPPAEVSNAVQEKQEQVAAPIAADIQPSTNSVSVQPEQPATNISNYQHADQPDAAEEDATEKFRSNLALLEASFSSDKEAVAANVRNCMEYLQNHPELKAILQPEDVQQMVRGLRTSYAGISSAKRSKKTKAKVTNKAVDDVVDLLAGFDLSI